MPWTILPAAGMLLVVLMWLLGGVGASRIHPAIVTFLVVIVLMRSSATPHWVLQRGHMFTGDVTDVKNPAQSAPSRAGWLNTLPIFGQDALFVSEPASSRLTEFTTAKDASARPSAYIEALIRDEMPALEDLIQAGHPGPIGCSSAIAVIIGGLFLLHRGLIDYRIPLLVSLSAFLAFFVLPMPLSVGGQHGRYLSVMDARLHIDRGTAVTFASYEVMASPMLFTAFFLATAPAVRPMTRRARTIYAVLTGVGIAAGQLYVSVAWGPYAALLLVSWLTVPLDRWFRSRPLI